MVIALTEVGVRYDMTTGYGETVLHMVARDKHEDIMEHLLKCYKDEAFVNVVDFKGQSALHIAANGGLLETTINLVEAGAKVNRKDAEGLTSLHMALEHGDMKVVRYLLGVDCEVNDQSRNGITPLHIAVVNYDRDRREKGNEKRSCDDKLQIIKLLLEANADLTLCDIQDNTVLFYMLKSEIMQQKETDLQLLRTALNYRHVYKNRKHGLGTTAIERLADLCGESTRNSKQIRNILNLLLSSGMFTYSDYHEICRHSMLLKLQKIVSIPMDLKCLSRLCIRGCMEREDIEKLDIPASIKQFLYFDCEQ